MIFEEKKFTLEDGRCGILRNARIEDAAVLIDYLKKTASETPFLSREPEEITVTPEQEKEYIQSLIDSERELMLIAMIEGRHAGNCSILSLGNNNKRFRHRCGVGIALYREFCDLGIGRLMLQTILDAARIYGYEQAELEVIAANEAAVGLYKNMGFKIYGSRPQGMKYSDETYADQYLMNLDL